jgi:CelD/BcsL family acetyltransferase involved in cellulose biosynthesis
MRRLEHELERELGELTLTAPDFDPDAFDRLVAWKSDQFARTGLHDVLRPAWSQALMRALFETREGPLQGLMITLRVAGRPIAGHFGVRQGSAFHPWLAAFDPALAAYSPGQTFMGAAIRAMTGLGIESYDLSAGHEHYKKPFASEAVAVGEGTLRAAPWNALRDTAWDIADRTLGRRADALRRVRRRFDHIAAAELSLSGRLQGLALALAAGSRRLGETAAPAPIQAESEVEAA